MRPKRYKKRAWTCAAHRRVRCKWCKKRNRTLKYFSMRGCKELTLYDVKFTVKCNGMTWHKIGLTSKTVTDRFSGKEYDRFTIEICKTEVLPLSQAVEKESNILYKLWQDKRSFRPPYRFTGRTECYR